MQTEENSTNEMEKLPVRAIVLPLLERPLFPETFTTLLIGRHADLTAIMRVTDGDGFFVAVMQEQNGNFRTVGTLSRVTRYIKLPNNCYHLFVSTIERVNNF